jgi:hypothetical protein
MTRLFGNTAAAVLVAAAMIATPRAARAQETAPPAAQPRDTVVADTDKAAPPAPPRRTRRDVNKLTREELTSRQFQNAFEAVQSLRPLWLRTRGASSGGYAEVQPKVYLDQMPSGTPEVLRSVRIDNIETIEYLRPADATTRFGTDHNGGAILVTRRGT